MHNIVLYQPKPSWNKGKLVGQKLSLKLEEVWSIKTRLDLARRVKYVPVCKYGERRWSYVKFT